MVSSAKPDARGRPTRAEVEEGLERQPAEEGVAGFVAALGQRPEQAADTSAELVAQAKRGDPAAREELIERFLNL
jgi:hypothetical protein